ncbi:MAG: hypothetical protein NTV79_01870 [Candidatus Aureabacteria bacterium]|nr:hypothetical protein [Candidatus Auribacterota bacterium]
MAGKTTIEVRFAIEANAIGQAEMARILGWSTTKVNQKVKGVSRLSLDDVEEIITKTGIRREFLLLGEEPKRLEEEPVYSPHVKDPPGPGWDPRKGPNPLAAAQEKEEELRRIVREEVRAAIRDIMKGLVSEKE